MQGDGESDFIFALILKMKAATTLMVFCVSSLVSLGLVMMYSAGNIHKAGGTQFFVMQFISFGIGLTVCIAAATLDYRILRKLVWVLFAITIVLLVGVLFTKLTNGSRRWFKVGGFSFQPSELAKLSLILALAWYAEKYHVLMPRLWHGILRPALFIGPVLALVVVEPDVGTTILLGMVSMILLVLGGVKLRYCLPPALICVAALAYFIANDGNRSERIRSWLHVEETKQGRGLQAWEARLAFGSGGWAGRGLGSSRQKLERILPEHHTDFILPIIGEELGLPATLGVTSLFAIFVCCGYRISSRAPDTFGVLLGAGITFLVGTQAFVNIAVVTGVLPNKGLPLPFISYGGSNLIMMLGCVGVLLSIARHAVERPMEHSTENPFSRAYSS